jgi:CBS domain-containing protein
MKTSGALRRSGIAVTGERTVRDAAQIMEEAGVGALVVVDGHVPIGVVTDRDLVRRCLAKDVPHDARVDSVMSTSLVTIEADADLHSAYALFRSNGVRRLIVVDHGAFIGVLSVDDLLVDLAADLADLARPVTGEVIFGQHDGKVPARI